MCKVCDGTADNRGHVWKLDEGELDIFGLDIEGHNGPVCIRCGYSFCHHCSEEPTEDCRYKDQEEMPV